MKNVEYFKGQLCYIMTVLVLPLCKGHNPHWWFTKSHYWAKLLNKRSLTHRVFCNDIVKQWPWQRSQGQRSRSCPYVIWGTTWRVLCVFACQPTNQSINQSINHDHDQSTNNDHDQSINHVSVSCVSYRVQPTNQPTNQSIN